MGIVTLTTDFGTADGYAAEVKGALLSRVPGLVLVDGTHEIEPGDVAAAAWVLDRLWDRFPVGTVHLVVVDPGVGGDRAILAARSDDYLFIAPDNGILSLLIGKKELRAIHRIENKSLFAKEVSATFHGRDIMAPVAAQLAAGLPLSEVGPLTPPESCLIWDLPEAQREGDTLAGRVIHIDHFGNIQTSISVADLPTADAGAIDFVRIRNIKIEKFCHNYSQQTLGGLLALIDSGGYLEIAANQGNAADVIGCGPGEEVTVVLKKP